MMEMQLDFQAYNKILVPDIVIFVVVNGYEIL